MQAQKPRTRLERLIRRRQGMTLHCPHCLNNWPCNEPLESCVRRNKFINRSHKPKLRRNHTRARTQETAPRHASKLPNDQTYIWRGEIVSPVCACDLQLTGGEHMCNRKTWRWRHKEAERLSFVDSGKCSGKPPSHPAGDWSLTRQTKLLEFGRS